MNSVKYYLVLAMAVVVGAPSLAQARQPKTIVSDRGISTIGDINQVSTAFRFSPCGANGSRGGSVSKVDGNLPRLCRVRVNVSTSWEWITPPAHTPEAALVDVAPQSLEEFDPSTFTCTPFATDATVTLTALDHGSPAAAKGEIVADIVGGTVSHVVLPGDPRVTPAAQLGGECPLTGPSAGTIDETLISFDSDPGQPNTPHGSISGTSYQRFTRVKGLLRARFNSCTGEFDINQIIFEALDGEDSDSREDQEHESRHHHEH